MIQLSGQSEPLGWLTFYFRPVEQETGAFDDHPEDQISFGDSPPPPIC
jgi:hypothetical protein